MCTAAMQQNLPDFMTNLSGTSITVPDDGRPRPIKTGADVPLGDSEGADEISIRRRRERIKQAQANPGSHKPTGARTRKDLMDELT